MKKQWLVMIGILFFLWGCEAPPEPETLPATQPEGTVAVTEPTVPSVFYLREIEPELSANDALRFFSLPVDDTAGIRMLGEDILLFSGYSSTVLTLISGEAHFILAQADLNCPVSPSDPSVTVTEKGISFFDGHTGELVFLDTSLEEIRRIPIPAYRPGVTQDWSAAYYCTAAGLRVMDLESGITRLLKEMAFPQQELTAMHCSGTVLECSVTGHDGDVATLFIDVSTGTTLREVPGTPFLWTDGDFYITVHYDGSYPELLSGSEHFGPNVLIAEHRDSQIEPVSGSHALILTTCSNDAKSSCLDYYDLETGCHAYQVTVPGKIQPLGFHTDSKENVLWFVYHDPNYQSDILCRWDLSRSCTGDSKKYLQSRYHAQQPDLEGLQRCQRIADAISGKHGVRILLWTDAITVSPQPYTLIPEYQVPWIEAHLEQLDSILSRYPAGFLEKAASQIRDGQLRICLLRAIRRQSDNSADTDVGLAFWDRKNNAYLAIAAGDGMELALHHALFHLIDSRVLCTGSAYDSWEALNPDGFEYDLDYEQYRFRQALELVEGANRAFTDYYAMSYPREDRARIMAFAMMPGYEECFSSEIMQKKLLVLCKGIRDAFGPPPASGYPWEQYLSDPIS